MTHLSTGSMSPSPYAAANTWVAFTVWGKFNAPAGYGKRMERKNEIEKYQNLLEAILVAYEADGKYPSAGDNYGIEFSKPVKYTNQFGDKPVEFTVNGNLKVSMNDAAKKPTAEVYVDADAVKFGYGATNNGNRVVDSAVDAQAATLWDDLQALSDIWTITAISYNGVMYGKRYFNRGGRTL